MKINTKIRYGLRMVVAIAKSQRVINTNDLGKEMMVSPKYLRKLAGPLEKSGIIKSVQGIHGGYALNRDADAINLKMILEAFGEKITLTDCLDDKNCRLIDSCLTRRVWQNLETAIRQNFSSITVGDILAKRLAEPRTAFQD